MPILTAENLEGDLPLLCIVSVSITSSCAPQKQQSLNLFPLASTVKSWLNTSPAVTGRCLIWQQNKELWVVRWAASLFSCILRRQPAPANTGRAYLCNIFVSSGSFLAHLDMHSFDWFIPVFKWMNKQLTCNFWSIFINLSIIICLPPTQIHPHSYCHYNYQQNASVSGVPTMFTHN